MDEKEQESDGLKYILEEWKTVIETQMHFNEMIMKMRTTTVSVVIGIFGAAAYSLQYNIFIPTFDFLGLKHASFFIILLGLGMLIGIFFLDYFYYFKLLLGAVERGKEIDHDYKDKDGFKIFGMTTLISEKMGNPDTTKYFIWFFYGIICLIGVCFLYFIFNLEQIDMFPIYEPSTSPLNSTSPRLK